MNQKEFFSLNKLMKVYYMNKIPKCTLKSCFKTLLGRELLRYHGIDYSIILKCDWKCRFQECEFEWLKSGSNLRCLRWQWTFCKSLEYFRQLNNYRLSIVCNRLYVMIYDTLTVNTKNILNIWCYYVSPH
jgi:hypothetical protein